MLYIGTDLENKNWLVYLIEEFKRINKAKFDTEVADINLINTVERRNVIYYTKIFNKGPAIINRSNVLPGRNILNVTEDIFVIEGTITDDIGFEISYDLFWNAFVFLSRLEEYLSESCGKKIKSYSFNHPRADKTTFYKPIVNNLFNKLEKIIREKFPGLSFGEKDKPIIELSHDVDYINKTLQLKIKQTSLNVYNNFKYIFQPKKFFHRWCKIINFLFTNPSYWCFDYWIEEEKKINKRSIFYVYSKAQKKDFRSWLIDPSYDIGKNCKLKEELKKIIADGFEVGLHGSFNSAVNGKLLAKEKDILSSSLNWGITRVRQHWLRYEEEITPYLHNELFERDSTIGWNDLIGFRSGCASKYMPYDHKNQKSFRFFIVPQIIMDSNIFDYSDDSIEMTNKAMQMLKILSEYKTSYVAISWHQRSCNNDYGWVETYKELLKLL